ncbi:MAG: hypothetical protein P8J17_13055 [Halioglobus sp.]|nr:hypothetical protein [Halioglobus sp.]
MKLLTLKTPLRKLVLLIFLLGLLSACGGGGGSESTNANNVPPPRENIDPPQEPRPPSAEPPAKEIDPLDSWVAQMKIFAGDSAQSCGAPSGRKASLDQLNECFREKFETYAPFYGSHTQTGVDSLFSTGLAYDGSRLFIVGFDTYNLSFVRGGYSIGECIEPRYSNENGRFPPFLCDEYVDIEPRAE